MAASWRFFHSVQPQTIQLCFAWQYVDLVYPSKRKATLLHAEHSEAHLYDLRCRQSRRHEWTENEDKEEPTELEVSSCQKVEITQLRCSRKSDRKLSNHSKSNYSQTHYRRRNCVQGRLFIRPRGSDDFTAYDRPLPKLKCQRFSAPSSYQHLLYTVDVLSMHGHLYKLL